MSYIIEDNIDFYDMLYNDNHEILHDDNICLISNKKLDDNHIKLFCGHTFNYESLYKEIISQKIKKSGLEITRLKEYQIKCPYCRNIQNKLIPYIKLKGIKKIIGVNHPLHKTMATNKCKYIYKSGKRKGFPCDSLCYNSYCNKHESKMKSTNESKLNNDFKNTDSNDLYESLKKLNKHSQDVFLSEKTVKVLREIAKKINISKYYRLRKSELITSIKKFILEKDNENK